jgi:hypothetical protein
MIPPPPQLASIGKASACHTEMTKTKREGCEVVIIAVLAKAGCGASLGTAYVVFFTTLLLQRGYPN